MSILSNLYMKYVRAGDHPCKLRIINFINRWFMPSQGFVVPTDYGLRMLANPADGSDAELFFKARYEPETTRFLVNNVREGDVAVCAGVSFGLHLMLASRQAGETGKAIGIEPQPVSVTRASDNIRLNELPGNIHLVCAALSSKNEILQISEAPAENRGWSSLYSKGNRRNYTIFADTLEKICASLQVEKLDFMLLDVEGHELPIISSFSKSFKPATLIAEVHPYWMNELGIAESDYFAKLSDLGYRLYDLTGKSVNPGMEICEHNLIATTKPHEAIEWNQID